MTGCAGAQDTGKIARALLRLQFERFFDWNSATGFKKVFSSLTSAKWTAQPLRKTPPWKPSSRFLLRDRDRIFRYEFVQQLTAMGVATCLDHVIVFNEAILAGETSRHLQSFGSWIIAAETTWAYRRTHLTQLPVQPPGQDHRCPFGKAA
jgi:hypothetical protein